MKKAVGLAIALLALGCSWSTDFVVVNAMSAPVTITYYLKQPLSNADYDLVWPPETASAPAAELDDDPKWQASPAASVSGDQVIRLTLEPQTAVRIATAGSYGRPDLDSWNDFPIEKLEIATPGGTLTYCGPALLIAFEGGRFRQEIIFRGTPRQIASGLCG